MNRILRIRHLLASGGAIRSLAEKDSRCTPI
jgi:hypothetical protein